MRLRSAQRTYRQFAAFRAADTEVLCGQGREVDCNSVVAPNQKCALAAKALGLAHRHSRFASPEARDLVTLGSGALPPDPRPTPSARTEPPWCPSQTTAARRLSPGLLALSAAEGITARPG